MTTPSAPSSATAGGPARSACGVPACTATTLGLIAQLRDRLHRRHQRSRRHRRHLEEPLRPLRRSRQHRRRDLRRQRRAAGLGRAGLRRRRLERRGRARVGHRPAGAAARRAGPRDRGAPGADARTEPDVPATLHLRPRPEHGRRRPAGAGRHGRPDRQASATPRCSTPTARSTPPTSAPPRSPTATPSPRPARSTYEPKFTQHGFRYVEITGTSTAAGGRRRDRRRVGLRPGRHRRPDDLEPDAQPAGQQHLVGPARQLPLDPDRHPGPRRAARLDRRHQRVRPDRELPASTPARSCRKWMADLRDSAYANGNLPGHRPGRCRASTSAAASAGPTPASPCRTPSGTPRATRQHRARELRRDAEVLRVRAHQRRRRPDRPRRAATGTTG